ncbi:hypothetical protein CLV24_10921 [Pontibacter ummariensis]|uniref:ABC-three component systems C-terminal domain-containing protein n=1 Tax=Pontibacter ummariensis TaxID=1610492 RepID=A0A239FWG6_9BACT|nr:ABC-three component system protein [Pontibacter ummariensis]PRY11896.1 hypothetical protein CLV24_10921 [Pontibacter ummariensis]SNS61110.1 hypothetical protein SAMN06296052_109149 [Pontibacter ummariensis]
MKYDYIGFSLIVCGGSGCIFKVHGVDYMYVLTAKHLIEGQKVTVKRQFIDEDGQPKEISLKVLGEPFLNKDVNKDAAILKVEYLPAIESLARWDTPLTIDTEMTLAGFPNSRSKKTYGFRMDKLTSRNSKEYNYIECKLSTPSTYGEIVGLSGGGTFHSSNGQHYLTGIQSKMAAEDDEEMLNNVDIMPLAFFDDIIAEHDELVPLVSEHLLCFSTLKSYALKLEGCYGAVQMDFTRNYLQDITDEIIANKLTPTVIREFFTSKLLVYEEDDTVLGSRGLWIAWLEFLVILRIIKEEQISGKNIESLFNEFRLIYSDTDGDWTNELPKIFRSNFYGMSQDAKVIVATQAPPVKWVIANKVIPNIISAHPLTKKHMQIDVGLTHPLQNFKLMHLYAFQRIGIIDKEDEYYNFSALNEPELFEKLKTEFNAIFA